MVPPGQVDCVTASGQPGRGFESAVMPKVKLFWQFSVFRSFLLEFLHNYRDFTVLILIIHAYGEDPSALSSLSPILPSSSEELWFISPVIYLLLRSVVHCLTLIPLLAGKLWTILRTFYVVTRHVIRPGYMCLSIVQHIGGSILATTHYPRS